ncbi:MAG TPA: signal peptidase II, partial [Ktedonobacterales bacterium]
VLGGAVGNLLDRFAHQYVIDFIHFQIPGVFNFAVFNVADSAITIGVIVIAVCLYRIGPGVAEQGSKRVTSASGQGASERQ